jgi:hypothetical protein
LRNLCAVLFTAAALLVGATSANAQSEIFYNWNTVGWVMGPNGEGATQTVKGEPSHFKHAGHRWFLVLVWNAHPQLHAVREDGTSVQLTFVDGTVHISPYDVRWAKDDSKIAFPADIYAPDGSYVTRRIYLANVNFTGGIPALTSDLEPVVASSGSGGFDLSPDSTQIVYVGQNRGLMITTIGGATVQIMSEANSPRWSHNGQRIAFRSEDLGLVGTVRTDGSGLVTLAKDTISKNFPDTWGIAAGLRWAPDDSALIYSMDTRKGGYVNRDIFRVSASGGKPKNLTSGTGVYLTTVAWRSTINVE